MPFERKASQRPISYRAPGIQEQEAEPTKLDQQYQFQWLSPLNFDLKNQDSALIGLKPIPKTKGVEPLQTS